MRYALITKPILSYLFSLIALIILSPLFLFLIIFLGIAYKGNPFFMQVRIGKRGKPFHIIKFRSMSNACDKTGHLLPDEQRLTRLGIIIRSFSLDELPQLINVLKGDMALIGPRPLLPSYLPLYNERQARRHEIKPGLTGWAQVSGRNLLTWEQKFELDVWYIDHCSIRIDAKIFIMTVKKILDREGISSQNSATMDPFKGNEVL
ncbi:MAG: sugar transferase [Bacteroidales bacterium]